MSSTSTSAPKATPGSTDKSDLEESYLKSSGLKSLDQIDPLPAPESQVIQKPRTTQVPEPSAAPVPAAEQSKSSADAKTSTPTDVASDILGPFIGIRIQYASRKSVSSFWPSSRMLFYIVHLLNSRLVDHYYFKRYCPDYHPYILRLYVGILFYIQCARAALETKALPSDQHQFVIRFLQAYPPESLPVPGPLITLFKSLCTSIPEILSYGKVYPRIPPSPGPKARKDFWLANPTAYMQPNVPGVFALLEHLNSVINGEEPKYPKKGKHDPVPSSGNSSAVFGHHTFAAPSDRTPEDKWSLTSAGLEYLCEADAKLHEGFAERYDNFDFPATAADDNLSSLEAFLGLDKSMSWFAQVKDVAACIATYCNGSGTLADCPPAGLSSNQIVVQYLAPTKLPTPPSKVGDPASAFPFSFQMNTTARQPPQLAETIAAQAQTNVRMFTQHPFAGRFGNATHRVGKFWDIRPIEKSDSDYESYLGLVEIVRLMIKSRV